MIVHFPSKKKNDSALNYEKKMHYNQVSKNGRVIIVFKTEC